MPFALVQGHGNSSVAASTTFTNTFSAAVTSGNCVVGMVRWYDASSQTITSVTDDKGNTYNLSAKVTSGVGGVGCQIFWRGNITNAPITVTVNMSAATQYFAGIVTEFSGVLKVSDPKDVAAAGQAQINTTGPSTDNVTSGNITPVTNGCLIWGATDNLGGTDLANTGTGFTTGTTYVDSVSVGSMSATEYLTQATAGTIAATFSSNVNTGGQSTFVLALKPDVVTVPQAPLLARSGTALRSMRGPSNRFNAPMLAADLGLVFNLSTLDTTEAADIAALAGTVGSGAISGTLATTEAADVAAFSNVSILVTGTLTVNEVGVGSTGYSFPQNSALNFVIGTLSVSGIDTVAFNGFVGVSGPLTVTEAKDTASFAGTLPGVNTGTLVANEAGVSSTSYSFLANSAINTIIGTLSVVGIDVAVFNGAVGVNGVFGTTGAADTALFNGQVIPIGITGTLAATTVPDNAAFNGTVSGITGQLGATDTRDIVAFSGVAVNAGQLAATDARDTAAFNGFLVPLPDIFAILQATESADSGYFIGGAEVEEAPADFANWKFGKRFDRSLTSRFPWQG